MPEKPDENGYYHVTNCPCMDRGLSGRVMGNFRAHQHLAGAMNYLVSLTESPVKETMRGYQWNSRNRHRNYPNWNINIDLQNDEGREVTTVTIFICLLWLFCLHASQPVVCADSV